MKEIFLLLRIRFLSLFASMVNSEKNKKRGTGTFILMGLLFLFVFALFAFISFGVFATMAFALLAMEGDFSFYFALAAVASLALSLFGSVFATQGELYGAKDNELLLSMPLHPSSVFISRLLLLYLLDVLMGAVIVLPAAAAYFLFVGFSPVTLFAILFYFFLLSLVSLAISCFLGWLVTLITARVKHKNILSTVTMVVFFLLYMALMMGMEDGLLYLEENMGDFVLTLTPYLTVFNWVGHVIVYGDALQGLFFILLSLAIILPVAFFLIRTYTSILTAGRSTARYEYKEKKVKSARPIAALVRKDVARFFGSASYMMNAGIGIIFLPVIVGFLLFSGGETLAALREIEGAEFIFSLLPALVADAFVFMSSMVIISAPAVSLEAKTIDLLKSLPMGGRDILLAKAYAHIVLASPVVVLSALLAGIAIGASFLDTLALILLPLVANAFSAFLGVTFGVIFPKFNYVNEATAIKSGAAVTLTMFSMMGVSLVSAVPPVVLVLLGLPAWVPMLGMTGLLGLGCYLLVRYLGRGGTHRFAAL